jgi:hypothetical protein
MMAPRKRTYGGPADQWSRRLLFIRVSADRTHGAGGVEMASSLFQVGKPMSWRRPAMR